ncbi:MAG TPA: hypothetical protein PKB09_00145 [Candidatus Saccharibacteria bacterium]|nr:hypothetical protein [Candidatus Saccharibacteria bacterium]
MGEVIQFPDQTQQDLALVVGLEYEIGSSQIAVHGGPLAEVIPINNDSFVSAQDRVQDPIESQYARSTRALEALGRAALIGQDIENPRNQLFQEFTSSIGEMLKGDEEKGERLEVTRRDVFDFKDGHVVAYDGITPVVKLVKDGAEKSKQAAIEDSRMLTQHVRDKADERNAEFVDEMMANIELPNTRIVVSLEPVEAMSRDGDDFWEELNYQKGLGYMQAYHRNKDGSLSTLTLSVDGSEKDKWRALWNKQDIEIPEDETTDNWLDYALIKELDDDEFEDFAKSIRTEYYELVPDTQERESVEEIIIDNADLVDQVFNDMYEPLAVSLVTGKNTVQIQLFAREAMKLDKIDTEIRQHLWRISNSKKLSADDISTLEQMVRYGLVEKIRDGGEGQTSAQERETSVDYRPDTIFFDSQGTKPNISGRPIIPHHDLIRNLVGGINAGVQAGRSHGSCGGVTKLSQPSELENNLSDEIGTQDIFGGKTNDSTENNDVKDCEFVSKSCPKCGEKNAKTRVVKGTFYHVGKSCKS